jgi:hypothetical protein
MTRNLFSVLVALGAVSACGGETPGNATRPTDAATATDTAATDTAAPSDAVVAEDVPTGPGFTASCVYMNAFSRSQECRDYIDPSWTERLVATDCTNAMGTLRMGMACSTAGALGQCTIDLPNSNATRITFPGTDAAQCEATQRGCTVFARGMFTPLGACTGTVSADAGAPSDASATGGVFLPATRVCRDPLPGQSPGRGPNGQVCTWNSIAASTEEGRRFDDYASCANVRTQRPYYPARAGASRGDDPRMRDPAYTAELAWVRGQIDASGCVCCHSTRTVGMGTSNWYLEAPGNFMDTFFDTGLALGAGWIDSRSFGAYPPAENNGFDRINSGFPTTNPARMRAFFEAELRNRGRTRESFAGAEPFGGPIYDQLVYRPSACANGIGVDSTGALNWTGGRARYLYVLDATADSPGVPPNLDLPMGTRWFVNVPPTAQPFSSGITYGTLPANAAQRFPAMGAPAALAPGQTYYLYVLADIGIPLTRCLFTTPR